MTEWVNGDEKKNGTTDPIRQVLRFEVSLFGRVIVLASMVISFLATIVVGTVTWNFLALRAEFEQHRSADDAQGQQHEARIHLLEAEVTTLRTKVELAGPEIHANHELLLRIARQLKVPND